jgi:hypothetical protein
MYVFRKFLDKFSDRRKDFFLFPNILRMLLQTDYRLKLFQINQVRLVGGPVQVSQIRI